MDFKQMLPLMLKGKLGEREKELLKLTSTNDPAAAATLISKMYSERARVDTFAILKKIIPAKTLGDIIKYFGSNAK